MSTETCIAADVKNLARLRCFVEETALALGVAPSVIPSLRLAVDEAATNIIVHGYQGRAGDIEVEIRRAGDELTICLRDHAAPFDPTGAALPDLSAPLEQRPLGGLGVYLIRKAMDRIIHRPLSQGGNELTLIKKLS